MNRPLRTGSTRADTTFTSAAEAVRSIHDATFAPAAAVFRTGIEAEVIPIHRETHRIASVENAILPALVPLARSLRWKPAEAAKGAPLFELPGGGRLTFEPGGQIEYAAPPFRSPSDALDHLIGVLGRLGERLADADIDLYGLGLDPFNRPDDAALQIEAERYRRMDAYYARFGPAGARMMRQTASVQINVDSPCDPRLTWNALNALAPVLVATFANSRRYAGRDTGYASFRSHTWQLLDRTRTGLPWNGDEPERHYAEFALDARAMFFQSRSGEYLPFRHWIDRRLATPSSLATHLSTLFPEVRPRRYFEVRSVDALPLAMYAAPVMLIAGLTLDSQALAAAVEILGPPDTKWLRRAARHGLRDEALAGRAADVARLAIRACRVRPDLCREADVDAAEDFFDNFTKQARSPADAADAVKTAATAA